MKWASCGVCLSYWAGAEQMALGACDCDCALAAWPPRTRRSVCGPKRVCGPSEFGALSQHQRRVTDATLAHPSFALLSARPKDRPKRQEGPLPGRKSSAHG